MLYLHICLRHIDIGEVTSKGTTLISQLTRVCLAVCQDGRTGLARVSICLRV